MIEKNKWMDDRKKTNAWMGEWMEEGKKTMDGWMDGWMIEKKQMDG